MLHFALWKDQTKKNAGKNSKTIDIIATWRKENPHAHKADLYNTGLVSRSSVNRYWDLCGEGEEPYSAATIIAIWRYNNPTGTKAQCVRETGLSKRIVYYRWEKKQEENANEDVKIGVKKDGQLFFEF